ncbi:MAG: hypothetical protein IKS96_05805 [Fibrobacter sp.]|nr:hypothetical protein [Fibrobacter sp.]
MKKMLVLLFALATIVWAEIKVEKSVRINFSKDVFISENEVEETSEECLFFDKNKVRNDYDVIACGYAGLCRTMLDSNILLGWSGGFFFDDGSIEFYVLTGATHSVREIIEDEFVHYKKCYYFTNNDSIFKSIFEKIDSVLVPEINKCSVSKSGCSLIYDHSTARMLDLVNGRPNYEFSDFASDTVKARNAAISSIVPFKYKLETIRVQNHRLIAAPKLLGRQFTLFDVNGHELYRGTLKNNMQLPAYPTVIKIQGFGTQLLK